MNIVIYLESIRVWSSRVHDSTVRSRTAVIRLTIIFIRSANQCGDSQRAKPCSYLIGWWGRRAELGSSAEQLETRQARCICKGKGKGFWSTPPGLGAQQRSGKASVRHRKEETTFVCIILSLIILQCIINWNQDLNETIKPNLKFKSMVQEGIMSRTPSTSTQEIQMDMFDHHGSHAQVRETLLSLVRATNERQNTTCCPLSKNGEITYFVYFV